MAGLFVLTLTLALSFGLFWLMKVASSALVFLVPGLFGTAMFVREMGNNRGVGMAEVLLFTLAGTACTLPFMLYANIREIELKLEKLRSSTTDPRI